MSTAVLSTAIKSTTVLRTSILSTTVLRTSVSSNEVSRYVVSSTAVLSTAVLSTAVSSTSVLSVQRSYRNVGTSCQPNAEFVYHPLRKGLVNSGKCILYIVECHGILNMLVPSSCSLVLLSLVAFSPTGCL